jgi:hypothetical protein
MTRKSAKYSCMARTTSWSSASASLSSEDFLMILLKSAYISSQSPMTCVLCETRTDVVFAVLGISDLLDQALYRLGRGPYEA